MQGALPQIVLKAGGVGVAKRHAGNPGKHRAVLDLGDALQVDASRCEPAAIEHRQDVAIAVRILSRDDSHLERTIAASTQQAVGDALGGQLGAE